MLIFSAAVTVLSVCAVGLMRKVALQRALLDIPNDRSSHKVPVPRLGGAAFVPPMLLGVAWMWLSSALPGPARIAFFFGAALLYAISLIDDVWSLSTIIRFSVQTLASGAFVFSVYHYRHSLADVYIACLCAALVVGMVGLLNIYNFMDGIDGLAGLQALVGGSGWVAIALFYQAPASAALGAAIAAAALGFLVLNWPPAKIFMGDAGSTVVGYTFGALPLLVWLETAGAVSVLRLLAIGTLLVWPFLADGSFTIVRRLRRGENIFKAHRSHLYQRLVLSGMTHRTVTMSYGLLGAVGCILAWLVAIDGWYASEIATAVPVLLFVALLYRTCRCEQRASDRRVA
jgi:UDP-N-acetylmuramyl pentapeptide phosphotransferase/UDP-N-acetylglucosamine-1-phosphate transferase